MLQALPPSPIKETSSELKLPTKGLENVGSLGIKDFVLQFGDERFECSRFEASFFSPRIPAALLSDPTITEYELELEVDVAVESASSYSECLLGLLSLSRNGSFQVSSSNFQVVCSLAKSLGNQELCDTLADLYFGANDLNASSAGARFAVATFLGVSPLKEIDYLASHFYEIDRDVLKSLSHQWLRDILQSEKLQLVSEDSLVDFILELGDEYLDLLGFVRCEYLTVSGIDRVLSTISVGEIDPRLWESLCRRLRSIVSPHSFPEHRWKLFPRILCFHAIRVDGWVLGVEPGNL